MAMIVQNLQISHTHEQPLEKLLAMVKGDGEESYSKNSGLQVAMNEMWRSSLDEALERMTLPVEETSVIGVANLGSSSGPNTADNVAFVVDKLRHRLQPEQDAEFTAYFNDLPSNDFNNLFQMLYNDCRARNFYAAGVPGSYFHRLFPQASVNVFLSSICLQWLSEIPRAVFDRRSPAYNRGSCWILHSRSAVAAAYKQQAALDLKTFLVARAAELIPGGLLFISCLGRHTPSTNEPTGCNVNDFQADADQVWSDMVGEGLVTDLQRETFNLPLYLRSIEDIREGIASCGELFRVVTAKLEPMALSNTKIYSTLDPAAVSRGVGGMYRVLFTYLLEDQIGKEASMVFWRRFEKTVERRIRMHPNEDPKFKGQLCIVALIRN